MVTRGSFPHQLIFPLLGSLQADSQCPARQPRNRVSGLWSCALSLSCCLLSQKQAAEAYRLSCMNTRTGTNPVPRVPTSTGSAQPIQVRQAFENSGFYSLACPPGKLALPKILRSFGDSQRAASPMSTDSLSWGISHQVLCLWLQLPLADLTHP